MSDFPKISVISPSFNCARLIRNCIESVQSQEYPNFEHIIVDGASTDGTVEILAQYPHLKYLSEPDKGEAEALNKALRMVSGDVVNWLNVDDCYVGKDVFSTVVKTMQANPNHGVYYGKGVAVNEQHEVLWYRRPFIDLNLNALMRWFNNINIIQPALFYRREVFETSGPFREDLHYGIDYEYCLRVAAAGFSSCFIEKVIALATLVREGAKSGGSFEEQHLAWIQIAREYQGYLSYSELVNYWKDFYFFRIRPPVTYTHELMLPQSEPELHGFAIAALELGHIPFAAQAVERLTSQYPNNASTFFILSEVLNKTNSPELAIQALEHGIQVETKR